MTESRPVRLALIQFEAELGYPAKNTERACQMIAEAAEAGADLVLLPELFSTGYQLNAIGPILGDLVEPVDGPTVRALQEKYKGKIAPIQIPIMEGNKMTGMVNALTGKAHHFRDGKPEEIPVPEIYRRDLETMLLSLQETAAENDEVLLEKYFENGFLSREDTIQS